MKKLKLSNNINSNNATNNDSNANINNDKLSVKINKNKINLNSANNIKNNNTLEPILNQEQSIYKDVREELLQDFIDDMKENSINIEMSQEDIENANKKHKSLMIKKKVSYASIILLFLSIIGFGTYKTFFQRNYTGKEIALLANKYNNKTNFPESVVEGYLANNIDKLLKDKLTLNSDVEEIKISSPVVTRINAKNDNLANVYFYTNISTNMGDSKINCIIPIYWDGEAQECSPAGTIMITPNKSTVENVKEKKNDLLSFDDIQTETEENINSSKTFVDNFFNMLYSNQDVSPYYKGDLSLESNDLTYDGMSEYVLYKSANKNGYNATCKITLKMANGTSYSTQKYLTIKKSGESWIVMAVL